MKLNIETYKHRETYIQNKKDRGGRAQVAEGSRREREIQTEKNINWNVWDKKKVKSKHEYE